MKHRQTINGSQRKREVTQPQQHTEYYLFNSQGNLKAYSDDIMDFAYYGYNAANTRTYKLSLYNTNLWINGQQQPLNMQLQQAMFYPNTYLNFNQNGEYTKHYYNGTERIASRLGDNTTTIAINNNILEDRKLQLEEQFREDIHKLIEETVPIDLPPFIDVNALQPTGTPNDIYYYHPNHLGSTSFVTDQNQTITQGFLYAPFGEITTEFNINFGSSVIPKYSFNAKEWDEETGMYYYEARYYKPPVFTSRDPLFEKYPSISPYTYCMNNPVIYVDPTGKDTLLFSHNGYYENKLNGGKNIGLIKGKDGNYSTKFTFADERWCDRFVACSDEDLEDKNCEIKNNDEKLFNKVCIINNNCIERHLEKSGVNNWFRRNSNLLALAYAYRESRDGKMDFVNYDEIQRIANGQLYVITVAGKSMAHDVWNFGNFLWGAAMGRLGISPILTWMGSNYDCYKYNRQWDSMDDQRSIRQGYLYGLINRR